MRKTLKAEVEVTLEVPERIIRPLDNGDLADAIRSAVGHALQDQYNGSPLQVVVWQVWGADE